MFILTSRALGRQGTESFAANCYINFSKNLDITNRILHGEEWNSKQRITKKLNSQFFLYALNFLETNFEI